jgi:hypothetical protein
MQITRESDYKSLKIAFPQRTIDITRNIVSSSSLIIERIPMCFFTSECSLNREDSCYPEYIGKKVASPSYIKAPDVVRRRARPTDASQSIGQLGHGRNKPTLFSSTARKKRFLYTLRWFR